jgi:hypothetical protein
MADRYNYLWANLSLALTTIPGEREEVRPDLLLVKVKGQFYCKHNSAWWTHP